MMTRGFGRRKSKQHVSRTMASNFELLPTKTRRLDVKSDASLHYYMLLLDVVGKFRSPLGTRPGGICCCNNSCRRKRSKYEYYVYQSSTKSVDEELTAPKRTIRRETLLRGMPCDQFVQEVMWCNVKFHADHFLPAMRTDSKERKEKLRKLRLIAKRYLMAWRRLLKARRSIFSFDQKYQEVVMHVQSGSSMSRRPHLLLQLDMPPSSAPARGYLQP
eukprot:scaffold24596_cov164-Skeletonema_dohrnii-CCMP3373.AAC.2